ncbi:MAG: helix-turn-helix domain-containing protein [Actinomycetes bacterium]
MPKRARHLLGNDLVREARKRAGLTQRELAEKAGTTQSAIARLESGRTSPSFETVLHLVRACGLDLEVLLTERDFADIQQARIKLRMTPEERLQSHQRVVGQMLELRRAGQRMRGGAA